MNNNLENIKRIEPTFICFSDRKNIEKAFKKFCEKIIFQQVYLI